MSPARQWTLAIAAGTAALLVSASLLVGWLNVRGEHALAPEEPASTSTAGSDAAVVARGAALAIAGNCAGCHTERGGRPYAGGRAVDTPFGRVYASNLTPDPETGIGRWSAADFRRALHNGRSKDGRLLYPAFPYPSFTLVTNDDADAMHAFLRTLPAVRRPNTPHALRFPYNLQAALAVWRALYFRPARFEPDPARSASWNRGSYLVRGLGHCGACHAARNLLGATTGDIELGGGLIPMQNWYAPSLASSSEAGVAGWPPDEVVMLLKTGVSARATVMGPMAEVVFRSTQHMGHADLRAIADYLQALPQAPPPGPAGGSSNGDAMRRGAAVYADQCAECHGAQGGGVRGIYPPLAGNRAVTLPSPNNIVKAVLHGGFPPTTAGNPRPFGMPPFGQRLDDRDIAAVTTFMRRSWGHAASEVSALDVLRAR